MNTCLFGWSHFANSQSFWAAESDEDAANRVDPIELAIRAQNSLVLPQLELTRSPAGSAWVNENTWVWLENGWNDLTATARSGTVWATVTATPMSMDVSAQGAARAVSCSGPGRAWTSADGADVPGEDGCALRFERSGKATIQVSVPYEVSWTGSDGAGGDLGVMTTTGEDTVGVLETAAVNTW
ncbi:hypothetical protein GCM10027456_76380 [Kineosporia babensis]